MKIMMDDTHANSSAEVQTHQERMKTEMAAQFAQAAQERTIMISEYEKYKSQSTNAVSQVSHELKQNRAKLEEAQIKANEAELRLSTAMIRAQEMEKENERHRLESHSTRQSYETNLAQGSDTLKTRLGEMQNKAQQETKTIHVGMIFWIT